MVMDQEQPDGTDKHRVIALVEEHVTVNKATIDTATVNIHKTVLEEMVSVNLPIINETYEIQRINGKADLLDSPPAAVRYDEDKIIISLIKEVPVVVKKYQVTEEIHLIKRLTEIPLAQEVVLRKEKATITKKSANNQ